MQMIMFACFILQELYKVLWNIMQSTMKHNKKYYKTLYKVLWNYAKYYETLSKVLWNTTQSTMKHYAKYYETLVQSTIYGNFSISSIHFYSDTTWLFCLHDFCFESQQKCYKELWCMHTIMFVCFIQQKLYKVLWNTMQSTKKHYAKYCETLYWVLWNTMQRFTKHYRKYCNCQLTWTMERRQWEFFKQLNKHLESTFIMAKVEK